MRSWSQMIGPIGVKTTIRMYVFTSEKIAWTLQALRESADLSKSKLAEKMHVARSTVFNTERRTFGKTNSPLRSINLDTLERWANACGYDMVIEFKEKR